MSQHMRKIGTEMPLWWGAVRLRNGWEELCGPYPTKGRATQAINRALKEDAERKGCTYAPDPDAPAPQA